MCLQSRHPNTCVHCCTPARMPSHLAACTQPALRRPGPLRQGRSAAGQGSRRRRLRRRRVLSRHHSIPAPPCCCIDTAGSQPPTKTFHKSRAGLLPTNPSTQPTISAVSPAVAACCMPSWLAAAAAAPASASSCSSVGSNCASAAASDCWPAPPDWSPDCWSEPPACCCSSSTAPASSACCIACCSAAAVWPADACSSATAAEAGFASSVAGWAATGTATHHGMVGSAQSGRETSISPLQMRGACPPPQRCRRLSAPDAANRRAFGSASRGPAALLGTRNTCPSPSGGLWGPQQRRQRGRQVVLLVFGGPRPGDVTAIRSSYATRSPQRPPAAQQQRQNRAAAASSGALAPPRRAMTAGCWSGWYGAACGAGGPAGDVGRAAPTLSRRSGSSPNCSSESPPARYSCVACWDRCITSWVAADRPPRDAQSHPSTK